MNPILIQGLILAFSVPVAYIVVRVILKKSIVFLTGYVMILLAIISSFLSFWEGQIGIKAAIWVIPLQDAIGIGVLIIVSRKLREPLEGFISQILQLSRGNVDLQMHESHSQNEFGKINNALFSLSNKLKNIMGDLITSSDKLLTSSTNTSKTSERLSEGANEQASATEEISATMEQMASNIEQNMHNAQQTMKISGEAYNGISSATLKSDQALEASQRIAERISVINNIANQTNILALNAAVEAARAGEHGKGFSVVAAEVRKLAESSSKAAGEIVDLIQVALSVNEEMRELMTNTLPKIEDTNRLIEGISNASMEQNNGAQQVNSALQQLNEITQQNAAFSVEFSNNSVELEENATKLREVVSFFNLENTSNSRNFHNRQQSDRPDIFEVQESQIF